MSLLLPRVAHSISCFVVVTAVLLVGCGPSINRYALIEQSLLAGNPAQAAAIVEQTEKEYGTKSRVLYAMDRGLTLQLAGDYPQSAMVLEQAEEAVERLYTRTIRSETAAVLTNDNALPYEGDAYEHVMLNVVNALNYAVQGDVEEALVEARRIDHRLNVLSDQVKESSGYRNDGFARYLSGILYEAAGDLNNAFVAYRNAYQAYEAARGWSQIFPPPSLRADILCMAEALGLTTELDDYQNQFPDVVWGPASARRQLAQVVMISYNGRAPRKEDHFIDLPVSLDALQLLLLNYREMDSVLDELSGRVVRVALPRLISQKTQISFSTMTLIDAQGNPFTVRSEPAHNLTALAEKSLDDRMPAITAKALARAAIKFALSEGVVIGAQLAVGRKNASWVGLLVRILANGLAKGSEEADKRSWQTLPDEIHVARAWVPAGRYQLAIQPSGQRVSIERGEQVLDLVPGQTAFILQRVMQ